MNGQHQNVIKSTSDSALLYAMEVEEAKKASKHHNSTAGSLLHARAVEEVGLWVQPVVSPSLGRYRLRWVGIALLGWIHGCWVGFTAAGLDSLSLGYISPSLPPHPSLLCWFSLLG